LKKRKEDREEGAGGGTKLMSRMVGGKIEDEGRAFYDREEDAALS